MVRTNSISKQCGLLTNSLLFQKLPVQVFEPKYWLKLKSYQQMGRKVAARDDSEKQTTKKMIAETELVIKVEKSSAK